MPREYRVLEDFLQLDTYAILVMAFSELSIFAMLSTTVFNVFGAAPVKMHGCLDSDVVFRGRSKEELCADWHQAKLCPLNYTYEFASVDVEFGGFCGTGPVTWLDSLRVLGATQHKAEFSTTAQMFGLVVSCAYTGYLADSFGRKRALWYSFVLLGLAQIISSIIVNSHEAFIITRLIIGIFVGSSITIASIYVIESIPPRHRLWMNAVVAWAPNYILFALAAHFSHDWRTLARVSGTVGLLSATFLLVFLEESPKFLINRKMRKEAFKALKRINRFSKDKASNEEIYHVVDSAMNTKSNVLLKDMSGGGSDSEKQLDVDNNVTAGGGQPSEIVANEKPRNRKIWDLYLPNIRSYTIIMTYMQFTISLITYSLMFNMHRLGGTLVFNMFVSGILRYVVGASVAIGDHFGKAKVGRRRMYAVTVGGILVCLLINAIIFILGKELQWDFTVRVFALLAFGISGCVFLQIVLSISEIFPTSLRTNASAHLNVAGRFGTIFGPSLFRFGTTTLGWPPFGYSLLSLFAMLDLALYYCFIPETKNIDLPNEIEEVKKTQKESPSKA